MINKIFELLYNKVLVGIVVGSSSITVHIEILSKNETQSSFTKEFETSTFNDEVYEYIYSYISQTPYYYVSILDYHTSQGALPTCNSDKFPMYTDLLSLKHKCYKDRWSYYTTKQNVKDIEKSYEKIGVDFIFSPFVVLSKFFKDKLSEHNSMFVLLQDDFVSLSIFSDSQLLYALHTEIKQSKQEEDEALVMEDDEDVLDMQDDEIELDSIDLDDVDIDDAIGSLDDFGDIEDLDSLDDIEDFSDSKDLEEELEDEYEEANEDDENEDDEKLDSKDYDTFLVIQNAIENYYKDDLYDSEFIEKIYIADTMNISDDLKRYVEDELFLSIYIRKTDLVAEVCDLTKMELGL